ncbi:hypothetical protein ACFL4F_03775 [Candidatus Margulisiibacteriota bacterium]
MRLFTGKTAKSKAFTLMEVLLVIIILVSVFFPLILMLSTFMIASGEATGTNTALKLSQGKLETLKHTAYGSIVNEAKAAVTGYPEFNREVVITEPGTNLKNVRIIVYWFTSDGSELSVEVQSIITNY